MVWIHFDCGNYGFNDFVLISKTASQLNSSMYSVPPNYYLPLFPSLRCYLNKNVLCLPIFPENLIAFLLHEETHDLKGGTEPNSWFGMLTMSQTTVLQGNKKS